MDVHTYTLHDRSTLESQKTDTFSEPELGDLKGKLPSKWFEGTSQLNDFLASDLGLLVITLPLTRDTQGMIGTEQLEILSKPLDSKKIWGAALDVTNPEPLPADHHLWTYDNVIITPHCAGNSNHFNERTLKIPAYNMERRAEQKDVVNKVS
ncbi:D-isomer specific 2-hydroxyacid dehydrogenase [Penicillium sp. IBT 35674x]|nr:D-isomer specific 2-hydroxyacid dehydrogenase [Penicillium sp. IBT 35674x]